MGMLPGDTGRADGGAAGGGGPYRPAPSVYEFSERDNECFTRLARTTRWVAIVSGVAAVAAVAGLVASYVRASREAHAFEHAASSGSPAVAVGGLLQAAFGVQGMIAAVMVLFDLFLCYWMLPASKSFLKVATTQGNDVPHLLDALRCQQSFFRALRALIVLALVLGLAAPCLVGGSVSLGR